MFQKISTDSFNWIFLIGIALLFVELIFFKGGLVFSLLFLGFLVFLGRKSYHRTIGKIIFWFGVIGLFLNIINLFAIRFVVIAAIILLLIQYHRSKKEPEMIKPQFPNSNNEQTKETLLKKDSLFQNLFLGSQQTSETPYQWRDVNIHGGIGDRIIDLSNTVLPDDPVISIRHLVGNIIIYVPYEVEVCVHHSSVFGRASFFQHRHRTLMNHTLSYQTENYQTNIPRVKIVTSILSGDIEVKRI